MSQVYQIPVWGAAPADSLERKPNGCRISYPIEFADDLGSEIIGYVPSMDGEINEYDLAGGRYAGFGAPGLIGKERTPRASGYGVVFVNGIKTSGLNHRVAAGIVAAVSGGRVTGIYNKTDGMLFDLAQCLGDRATFQRSLDNAAYKALDLPLGAFDRFQKNPTAAGRRGLLESIDGFLARTNPAWAAQKALRETIQRLAAAARIREEAYRSLVSHDPGMALQARTAIYRLLAGRNRATAELFHWLAERPAEEFRLVGHSQGTLILAVAIMALNTLEGAPRVQARLRAIALAPPVLRWPEGHPDHSPNEYAHLNDYVTHLGMNFGRKTYRQFEHAVHRKVIDCSGEVADTGEITAWVDNPVRTVCFQPGLVGPRICRQTRDLTLLQHGLFAYLENYWDKLVHHFP